MDFFTFVFFLSRFDIKHAHIHILCVNSFRMMCCTIYFIKESRFLWSILIFWELTLSATAVERFGAQQINHLKVAIFSATFLTNVRMVDKVCVNRFGPNLKLRAYLVSASIYVGTKLQLKFRAPVWLGQSYRWFPTSIRFNRAVFSRLFFHYVLTLIAYNKCCNVFQRKFTKIPQKIRWMVVFGWCFTSKKRGNWTT